MSGLLLTGYALVASLTLCVALISVWWVERRARDVDLNAADARRAASALKGAIDRISLLEGRMERLTGRVYSQARRPKVYDTELEADGAFAPNGELDPDLAAALALQNAPPSAPGKR